MNLDITTLNSLTKRNNYSDKKQKLSTSMTGQQIRTANAHNKVAKVKRN